VPVVEISPSNCLNCMHVLYLSLVPCNWITGYEYSCYYYYQRMILAWRTVFGNKFKARNQKNAIWCLSSCVWTAIWLSVNWVFSQWVFSATLNVSSEVRGVTVGDRLFHTPSIPSIPRTAKEKLLSSTARNGEKGLN